jgi:hypothetical protein
MHTYYQLSYPLVITTINQPLGDPEMSYNNELSIISYTTINFSIHTMNN